MKLGPTSRKVLLLLLAGVALSLTKRPDQYFRILDKTKKEWKKINQRNLHENIKHLHRTNLISFSKKSDGTISVYISKEGEKYALFGKVKELKINKLKIWDGFWRMIIFDIPEDKKRARDALAKKLKELGFYTLQKSVFVFPYECKKEIDFITDLFDVGQFVKHILAKEIDNDTNLKKEFKLN